MSTIQSNNNNHRITQIEKFLVSTPNDCFLLHALALEKNKLGLLDDAIQLLKNVLAINENYVGSYYHLGKLLEQKGEVQSAKEIYEKGIIIAKNIKDNHSANELRGALEELLDNE